MTYHQRAYREALQAHLKPGIRWCDLGAGARIHGDWTAPPLTVQPVGCDPSPTGMRRNPDLTARVVALGPLPFRDQSFDLITANMVLEHVPDPIEFLREVARCLAPGGRFLAVTPHKRHWIVAAVALLPTAWRSALGRLEGRAAHDVFPTHYRANRVSDLHDLAYLTGLNPHVHPFRSDPAGSLPERLAWRLTLPGPPSNLLVTLAKPRKPTPLTARTAIMSGLALTRPTPAPTAPAGS